MLATKQTEKQAKCIISLYITSLMRLPGTGCKTTQNTDSKITINQSTQNCRKKLKKQTRSI